MGARRQPHVERAASPTFSGVRAKAYKRAPAACRSAQVDISTVIRNSSCCVSFERSSPSGDSKVAAVVSTMLTVTCAPSCAARVGGGDFGPVATSRPGAKRFTRRVRPRSRRNSPTKLTQFYSLACAIAAMRVKARSAAETFELPGMEIEVVYTTLKGANGGGEAGGGGGDEGGGKGGGIGTKPGG